ncbi:DUF342 domain-containing protein [Desulfoscipio sp. XC116]|uniref:DUF342 domain-containing protein n=1 Tax=Desulfoscipio sp. XC116 TaxID=3144975 RepID=UPI00325B09DA
MSDEVNDVLLIITDDKMKAFFTVREPESVNKELIDKLVRDKGVKYGIDQQVLDDLIKSPNEGTFLFATGTPSIEGKDGYMQYLFSSRVVRSNEQDQQNVDFREVFDVPSVTANTVLAVYHPAVKGKDGRMVTGQVIPARKVMELTLRAAKGTVLSNDGMTVSSKIKGRPWAQKKGANVIVGVDAVYQHEGDVDIKSGNLRFHGDVVITGNIMENMIVDVQGNLRVQGFISRSNVKVKGSLEVMKVITAGKIVAGGSTVSLSAVEKELRKIEQSINSLNATTLQLMGKLRQNRPNIQYGQVAMTLLDKKFNYIGRQVRGLAGLVNKQKQKPPEEVQDAIQALNRVSGFKVLALQNLDEVLNSIASALALLDSLSDESAHVVANSVWNSEIEATGDIKITGQGGFNSRLNSLGTITIKGVFRGGDMYAQNGVNAGEIGGPMGITTTVRTEKGCQIKARRVYVGTVLQIGSCVCKINQENSMVLARVNEKGELILH